MVRGPNTWIRCAVALGVCSAVIQTGGRSAAQTGPTAPRQASLPTDRVTRDVENLPPQLPPQQVWRPEDAPFRRQPPKAWYEAFMFNVASEWEPEASGVTIYNTDIGTVIPLFPGNGAPPPLVSIGFSFTDLDAPAALDLPSELYDVSLGLRWLKPINDRWVVNLSISGALASDSHNESSDVWQFRGGLFAVYKKSRETQLTFGAIATGRDDIPVLPAAGVIWQPTDECRVDLILPRPRVSYLIADNGDRQQWVYAGGAITGGTWAYQRASGFDEQLTYREWRLVLGWESKPPANPWGVYGPTGIKYATEIGYAFGRKFEFESGAPDIDPDGTVLLRATVSR